ncbi:hypothetical protein niasHS_001839 [Heterodera schachtii]|uniref:Uncharacterized protein n=2 Tax=Heterodera TaxID=34509 RepID=A0ABD2KAN6_HETSC
MSSGFARRPIFSVLVGVFVLPHICAIQCWKGSRNNSGIREEFSTTECQNQICAMAHCTAGDFFFDEWACMNDKAQVDEKCGQAAKLTNQQEPLGHLGLTWTCECFPGDTDKDFAFVPPWLESTTPPPETTTEMEQTTAGVTDSAESKCFLSCFATIATTILAIIWPTIIANFGSLPNVSRMQ